MGQDFGRIEPHQPLFSQPVELALFALLTAPWENITVHNDFNWRPFRIPWVYTLDDDLFARVATPASADTLSWEPAFYQDGSGETFEYERPTRLLLEDDAGKETKRLDSDAWDKLMFAKASPLFATPVQHFLVRAFATYGIDEYLAHIMVIEAALGLVEDHSRRPKLPSNPGATHRVAARLSGLLRDSDVGTRYRELFDDRSNFVHGRIMGDIPIESRLDARRLARRCVCALVDVANAEAAPASRDAFLTDLLRTSWPQAERPVDRRKQ